MSVLSTSNRTTRAVFTVLCATLSTAGTTAQILDAGGQRIGVVDYKRLLTYHKPGYKPGFSKDAIMAELTSWDQHDLLPESDQPALGWIAAKEANKEPLTPSEKLSKQNLKNTYAARLNEFLTLQQKAPLTPGESERLRMLMLREKQTSKRIRDRQSSAQQIWQKQADKEHAFTELAIKTAIAEVVEAKGLYAVFGSDSLYRYNMDITDEVLKKLKSKTRTETRKK